MPTPETYFYYILSGIFASALIWVFVRYIGKNEKTMEKLQETDNKLTTMLTLHEHRITKLEEKPKPRR